MLITKAIQFSNTHVSPKAKMSFLLVKSSECHQSVICYLALWVIAPLCYLAQGLYRHSIIWPKGRVILSICYLVPGGYTITLNIIPTKGAHYQSVFWLRRVKQSIRSLTPGLFGLFISRIFFMGHNQFENIKHVSSTMRL